MKPFLTYRLDSLSNIFHNLLAQVVWTISATALTGTATYFITKHYKFTTLEIILFSVIIALVVGATSFYVYRRYNKHIPVFEPLDFDFHVIREERIHKWLSEDLYLHKRRYTLKALRNGLTTYTDKFGWTGKSFEISGGTADYKINRNGKTKNMLDVYHFEFSKPLQRGEIIEVEASWKLVGPAKPFFSTTIEEPTDLLIMSVMLYSESGVSRVICDTEGYKGAKVPYESLVQKLNSDGEYTWQINNPRLLHHYEINW